MRTEKLSLKSIKNVLSRAEMKKIMAGSGPGGGPPGGGGGGGCVSAGNFCWLCCPGASCIDYGGGMMGCSF
ncbi:MAG: hypothetical protein M3N14_04280 [Bacteroidota bacterium]|nr:hypothetical protein [Bacteroidota bacterium]